MGEHIKKMESSLIQQRWRGIEVYLWRKASKNLNKNNYVCVRGRSEREQKVVTKREDCCGFVREENRIKKNHSELDVRAC